MYIGGLLNINFPQSIGDGLPADAYPAVQKFAIQLALPL